MHCSSVRKHNKLILMAYSCQFSGRWHIYECPQLWKCVFVTTFAKRDHIPEVLLIFKLWYFHNHLWHQNKSWHSTCATVTPSVYTPMFNFDCLYSCEIRALKHVHFKHRTRSSFRICIKWWYSHNVSLLSSFSCTGANVPRQGTGVYWQLWWRAVLLSLRGNRAMKPTKQIKIKVLC